MHFLEIKTNMLGKYDFPIKNKERGRREKSLDKDTAKENPGKLHSVNFGLQQELHASTDPTNAILFYKTKLAT